VKANTQWNLETTSAFRAFAPRTDRSCAAGLVPLRRYFNNQASVNHRYVVDTDPALALEMRVTRAWLDEGVVMCVAAPAP
jgi:hypothetical protein